MTHLRDRLTQQAALFGAFCTVPDAFLAEMLGRAGFDFVCVDLQHGMVGSEALVGILQALELAQTPALVRVPWNEPAAIMRALDTGATGVVVPMVNSREEAERAVAACRYPPEGIRSWGPTRAALGRTDYGVARANTEVFCAVMIETQEAVAALDEILAVPGVDAVFVGPSDLAVAHGIPPSLQADDPRVVDLINGILGRCEQHGVTPALFTSGHTAALRWQQAGFRMLTVGSDRLLMTDACRAVMAAIRSGLG